MKRIIAVVLALSTVASLAHAQEAPSTGTTQSDPGVGVVVTLCRTGYYNKENPQCQTREFLERRGNDLVYLVRRDGEEPAELVVNEDLSTKVRAFPPATYVPHSFFLQFPLHVGKNWKGTFTQTSGDKIQTRTRTAEVIAYKDIVLNIGTFKAYEIRAYNQLSTATRPAVEKYFYCLDLGVVCAYESREFDFREEVTAINRRNK